MPVNIRKYCTKNSIKYKSWVGTQLPMRFTEQVIEPNDELYIIGSAMKNDKIESIEDSGSIKIAKSEIHPYYYISDSTEKELLKKFSWNVPLSIFGGAVLSISTLYLGMIMAIARFK